MTIWFGGDYNPEQWPELVWDEDVLLMQRAGVNLATVGVFSWSMLEPHPGEFDFVWLDRVLDKLHLHGVQVDLATATASPPPWLSISHPETLPVDESGVRLSQGSRQHFCPSSPIYRERSAALVRELVLRYSRHPAVAMWHVNNEYGGHVSRCYCDVSAAAFRLWLERKYQDVEALNRAWGTAFWSQRYESFAEILPPREAPAFRNPTQLLDFDRFSSDELLECFRLETAIIRSSSDLPITTNFMGFFKGADYWKWSSEVDVVSDDLYPDPVDPEAWERAAMVRDLVRSLGRGKPWLLMEQSASAVNWRPQNAAKLPGQMRAWTYQALARGSDGVLFFQWRQSYAGAERFHSAMLPHSGTNTRVWREVEALGLELAALDRAAGIAGTSVDANVAIVFDWDSWWAIEQEALPARIPYVDVLFAWHRALTSSGYTVDFAAPGADLAGYRLVIVPSLFVASDRDLANLHDFAANGGALIVGFATAVADENQHVRLDGYLGRLRETLGLRIEEFVPLAAPARLSSGTDAPVVRIESEVLGGAACGSLWSDDISVTTAEILARFADGPLAGKAAVTRNAIGGDAWYVSTQLDPSTLACLVSVAADRAGIRPEIEPVLGLEIVRRGPATFVINHGVDSQAIPVIGVDVLSGRQSGTIQLEPFGVAVVVDELNGS